MNAGKWRTDRCQERVADKSNRGARVLGEMKQCSRPIAETVRDVGYCSAHAELRRREYARQERIAQGQTAPHEVTFTIRGRIRIDAIDDVSAYRAALGMNPVDVVKNATTVWRGDFNAREIREGETQ